jgi:two-component system, OmpR family, alkaline phosphatase synthesis response regulator PhoP
VTTRRVLIVDDEPDIVEAVRFRLELDGYECSEGTDGEQGLAKAKSERPHVILLDAMMPKVDGYKVCRLLKADDDCKGIPIIMLTAKVQPEDRALGEVAGADAYITKPFDMEALVEVVARFVGAAA